MRRSQSREERVAELRDVLDDAAKRLTGVIEPIALANIDLTTIDITQATGADAEKRISQARAHLQRALAAQRGLWEASNRIRLRLGSQSEIAQALNDVEREVGELGVLVRRRAVNSGVSGYDEKFAKAEAAEAAFYDAAAAALDAPIKRQGS